MLSNAYDQTTTKQVIKRPKRIQKNTNTSDPQTAQKYISNLNVTNGYKESLIETYAIYIRSIGAQWNQLFYERYDKKRKAPKEELIDFIINPVQPVTKLELSLEKDLGTRPIELF
jgi:hypothetical protein